MSEQNQRSLLKFLPDRHRTFTCEEHVNSVSAKLISFYEAGEFCDITLVAGIGNFKLEAHRMVLSASSGYFKAMFRSNLRDTNEIKLEQWDGHTLKLIVDYMYTTSIDLTTDIVEKVLRAADFFQMINLVELCCNFLADQLNPCNCIRLVFFAEQHNYTELFEKALEYACVNFERVLIEQEFLEINAEQLGRFLSIDDIHVLSEKSVCSFLVSWIKYDTVNREPFLLGLMQHIRYPLLDARYILSNRDYLCINYECQTLIMDWTTYLLDPLSRDLYPDANTRPRKSCKKLFFLSHWEHQAGFKVETYDPEENQWNRADWPSPMRYRKCFASAVVGKTLYIAGGEISGHASNEVECLDMSTMQWSNLPSMESPRSWFALTELNGYLYAIGGNNNGSWSNTVVKYDLAARQWCEVTPMLNKPTYVRAAVLDNRIYVICGETSVLQCYDPMTSKWTQLATRNDNSEQFGLAALGGYLYTVGGHFAGGKSKTVERFDPIINAWTEVSSLSVARSCISVTTKGNHLIACGGHDGTNFSRLVEEYDPETDEWKSLDLVVNRGDNCSHLIVI